jgi:glycosyltransferase involved in cell wall biosynthesis
MIVTSVVIPSYQGAERLENLLGCLALQETDFEWEAVVVLDGSTDDSLGTIARWSSSVPVRVIDLGTNRGRSAALNAGFDAAMGRVLVRCDDDLAPDPNYVRRHTDHQLGRCGKTAPGPDGPGAPPLRPGSLGSRAQPPGSWGRPRRAGPLGFWI